MKMNKLICIALTIVMIVSFAACSAKTEEVKVDGIPAAEDTLLKNEGLQLTIPAKYVDLVIIDNPEDGMIFSVSEKASVESAKALGESGEGAGWLFGICRVSEDEMNEMLCYDMSGREVIAADDSGYHYIFCHPTDVRMVRESNEKMLDDRDQWTALTEWAWSVRESFVASNPGLRTDHRGNTSLEMDLYRILFQPGTNYTVSTLEYGPLDPKDTDATEYVRALTEGVTYEYADGAEAPDGEYAVLTFTDYGERFDFFFAEGGENYVRQVWGDEYEALYKATFDDPEMKASEVVYKWYRAIAEHTGGTNSYTADDLIGTWAEKIAGRCYIEISYGDVGDQYKINIHWGSSAWESSNWEMTAVPTGTPGQLRYENARCYIRTYSSETDYTDSVEYEKGSGTFTLNSAYEIMWDDETAHAGDNCVFVNVS